MQQHGKVLQAYLAGNTQALEDIVSDNAEFRHLKEHPAYMKLKSLVDGMYHSAAELALDQPENAQYLKGIREGIRILHTLLSDAVDSYDAAQRALLEMREDENYQREPVEPTPLMFGQSHL